MNEAEESEEYTAEEDIPDEFDDDFQDTSDFEDEEDEEEEEEEEEKKEKKSIFAPKKKEGSMKKFIEKDSKKTAKKAPGIAPKPILKRGPKVQKEFAEEAQPTPAAEATPDTEDRRQTRAQLKPKPKVALKPTKARRDKKEKEKKEPKEVPLDNKKKGKYIHDFYTQEELMKEAALTEILNKKSLVNFFENRE